jgi:hypothetical protein
MIMLSKIMGTQTVVPSAKAQETVILVLLL